MYRPKVHYLKKAVVEPFFNKRTNSVKNEIVEYKMHVVEKSAMFIRYFLQNFLNNTRARISDKGDLKFTLN